MSKSYTGMKVQRLKVPAYKIGVFDFTAPAPNYFRVQNRGEGRVFCSTSGYPTANMYDFSVSGEKAKLFAQPFPCGRLYILNPTGNEVEVVCTSFSAEFDPLALALSELEIEIPDRVESTSVITGFNSALPTGNNKIGSVDVANLSTLATLEKQNEILDHLSDMVSYLEDMRVEKKKYVDHVSAWGGEGNNGESTICGSGFILIHMLTNDGDNSFNVHFASNDGSNASSIELKPGESIKDLHYEGKIWLTGSNYSYRVMASYPI